MPDDTKDPSVTTAQNTLPAPDLAAVKARQRAAWGSGDYAAVATRIVLIAERLAEAADLQAGSTVLDVATGTGNAALAAARSGAYVTGVDYVPGLLDRAVTRAAAEGLDVMFAEGDAEALGFPNASFDAVLSSLGVMFTPDQERAASELLRVVKPGGTIALANWTPDSFIGGLLRAVSKRLPPPAGVRPATAWGTEDRIRELLGDGVAELSMTRRAFVFRYRSPGDFVDFFRLHYGPVNRAFAALDATAGEDLYAEIVDLVRAHDRGPGPGVSIVSDYLEVIATRR